MMRLTTSVIVTVALTMMVAGPTIAGPGGFPFDKCFTDAQKADFKKQLCTDLGQTEDFCTANKVLLKTCMHQIMDGTNAPSIIQASANCLKTVAGITVPAASTETAKAFMAYMKTIVTSIPDLCSKAPDVMTCFRQNSGKTQLMKDCVAAAGK